MYVIHLGGSGVNGVVLVRMRKYMAVQAGFGTYAGILMRLCGVNGEGVFRQELRE